MQLIFQCLVLAPPVSFPDECVTGVLFRRVSHHFDPVQSVKKSFVDPTETVMTRIQFMKINHKQTVMHSLGEFLDLSRCLRHHVHGRVVVQVDLENHPVLFSPVIFELHLDRVRSIGFD